MRSPVILLLIALIVLDASVVGATLTDNSAEATQRKPEIAAAAAWLQENMPRRYDAMDESFTVAETAEYNFVGCRLTTHYSTSSASTVPPAGSTLHPFYVIRMEPRSGHPFEQEQFNEPGGNDPSAIKFTTIAHVDFRDIRTATIRVGQWVVGGKQNVNSTGGGLGVTPGAFVVTSREPKSAARLATALTRLAKLCGAD
jgi:hypothetical protein